MKAAAKHGDDFVCLLHGPNPVLRGSPTVHVNGTGQLAVGHFARCEGVIKPIMTGCPRVLVNGRPAARHGDLGLDPGFIMATSTNVMIGEDTAGSEVGAGRDASVAACQAAAAGREGGGAAQTYTNCGIESSRQIIHQKGGQAPTEIEAYSTALRSGTATPDGRTTSDDRQALLHAHDVESEQQPQTREGIVGALADKKGVMTTHDAGTLYQNSEAVGQPHVMLVTGAVYDESGKLTHYRVNDTGTGRCGQLVPAARFEQSLHPDAKMNVTKDAIW